MKDKLQEAMAHLRTIANSGGTAQQMRELAAKGIERVEAISDSAQDEAQDESPWFAWFERRFGPAVAGRIIRETIEHDRASRPVAPAGGGCTSERLGKWLSAALDDQNVCAEFKADINAWLEAGKPGFAPAASAEPVAFYKDGVLFWHGEHASWRGKDGELYAGPPAASERAPVGDAAPGWQPIGSAPKDNKRPLYLARFDNEGRLVELDFDATWEYWEESWEMSHINGYSWISANGIEDPTHWAYQDEPLPAVAALASATVGDERAAFEASYRERYRVPAHVLSLTYPDVPAAWEWWKRRAALASAPVAGEALNLVTPHDWAGSDEEYAAAVGRGEVRAFHRFGATDTAPQASPASDGRDAAAKDVGLPDVLDAALNNLLHDNYERSYSGGKNREADVALIRTAIAAQQGEGGGV